MTEEGIFLGFEPGLNTAGEVSRYKVWLINNTIREIIFTTRFELKTGDRKSQNGKLDAGKATDLGFFQKDQLNDAPSYFIDCKAINTDGSGARQQKLLKIKARQFFKKLGTLPLLGAEGHVYKIFDDPEIRENVKKENSLRAYTKKHYKGKSPDTILGEGLYNVFNIEERAAFQTKIDLHIEKLTPDHAKLSNSEILALQMRRFREFMSDAIRLGVEEVYIIHGKGSGRLRNLIWQALDDYPEVEGKEGGYHEGYEFGATRVFF